MITMTDIAVQKIQDIFAEENTPDLKLRVFVQGGGCSGFQYGFTFDTQLNDDDFEQKFQDIIVICDSMSMQYLSGSVIDYREDAMGSSFVIENPQAQTTCGCGSSFSPY